MSLCRCSHHCKCNDLDTLTLDRDGLVPPTLIGEYHNRLVGALSREAGFRPWMQGNDRDFGVMVLDWWAYLLDSLSFYNGQFTRAHYLDSAEIDEDLQELVKLIGYQPRPNIAARADIIALSKENFTFAVGAGAGFQSEGYGDVKVLDFENQAQTDIRPERNQWTIKPLRETHFDAYDVLISGAGKNLRVEEPIVIKSGEKAECFWLKDIENDKFVTGEGYHRLILDRPPVAFDGEPLDAIAIRAFRNTQSAARAATYQIEIAGVVPQLKAGMRIALYDEDSGALFYQEITAASFEHRTLIADSDAPVKSAYTILTLDTLFGLSTGSNFTIYYQTQRGARAIGAPRTTMRLSEFENHFEFVEKHKGQAEEQQGRFVVHDAKSQSRALTGILKFDARLHKVSLDILTLEGADIELEAPLMLYGNWLALDQGKSVSETLGSSEGKAFQKFALGKKPLCFVADAQEGFRPEIEVFVDGIAWRRVSSFYGQSADDHIYLLEVDPDGQAYVQFGGQGYGAIPAAGQGNLTVAYRYATTGDNPDALRLNKMAGNIAGLSKLFNPFAAYGGLKADAAEDLRYQIPLRAMAGDRCVSTGDFAAHAIGFGALNAQAHNEWDPARKSFTVVVSAIFEGGYSESLAAELKTYLLARAAEETNLRIARADPMPRQLSLTIETSANTTAETATQQIEQALFDRFDGLLPITRVAIGKSYSRSQILAAIEPLSGVATIRALAIDGDQHSEWAQVSNGHYLAASLDVEVIE